MKMDKDTNLPLSITNPKEWEKLMMDNWYIMDTMCITFRGRFVHYTTELETRIDEILMHYFCPDDRVKREELFYVVFSSEKMTLFGKYQILSFIIHRYHKDFYDKHSPKQTGKSENHIPSLDTRINDIIHLRNKFAHRKFENKWIDIESFDGENITLDTKVGKNGEIKKSELKLNEKIMSSFSDEITALNTILTELAHIIIKEKE